MPQNAAPPRPDRRKPTAAGTGLKSRIAAYDILKLVASGRYQGWSRETVPLQGCW
jgi:hypothetical protein